jgi:hypothetical protein
LLLLISQNTHATGIIKNSKRKILFVIFLKKNIF